MDSNLNISKNAPIASRVLEQHMASRDYRARMIDLLLIILAAPYIILVIVIIAIFSKMDSTGPVFYGHERIGRYGR